MNPKTPQTSSSVAAPQGADHGPYLGAVVGRPSISIRGAEAVIANLKRLGLERFVRVKEEPNKEAMLIEPNAVRGVAGITINTGVEDFTITPFEVELQS